MRAGLLCVANRVVYRVLYRALYVKKAAADAGVKQFVFLSVHDYKAPAFVKRVGYFQGKRQTEKVVGELFGAKAGPGR